MGVIEIPRGMGGDLADPDLSQAVEAIASWASEQGIETQMIVAVDDGGVMVPGVARGTLGVLMGVADNLVALDPGGHGGSESPSLRKRSLDDFMPNDTEEGVLARKGFPWSSLYRLQDSKGYCVFLHRGDADWGLVMGGDAVVVCGHVSHLIQRVCADVGREMIMRGQGLPPRFPKG